MIGAIAPTACKGLALPYNLPGTDTLTCFFLM
jgi:hypothetical protein